jgi:ABC-type branched-subunit amino acid transport system ATPase component
MVIIGGMRSLLGPALGALFYVLFREYLSIWTPNWLLFFGLLFVGFVVFSPTGLVGVWRRLTAPMRAQTIEAAAMATRNIEADAPIPQFLTSAVRRTGAALSVDGIAKAFGGIHAVQDVALVVNDRTLHALIGPNGAGKTSVLNCISGIYRGTGSIRFRGSNIAGKAPHEIARLGLARTFQHGELFAQMSVLENLLAGRHARFTTLPLAEMLFLPSVRRAEIAHREAVERIIEVVELERYRHAPVGALPFGVQKIVGFARALALEPAVILMDEPSAGLNREERENLARFILRIKHELNMTIIWIEHDMQMIADLADRIHVLDYGRTLAEGLPASVLADPGVLAAYLGTATRPGRQ